jgi:hypothetical protein
MSIEPLKVQQTHSQSSLVTKERITILKTLPLTQRQQKRAPLHTTPTKYKRRDPLPKPLQQSKYPTNTSIAKMQSNTEEDLLDYNELEKYKEKNLDQHTSHSPVQTPPGLKSDEDSDEVGSDLGKGQDTNMDVEEGQEIEMDSTSTQQALVERKQKEFDILTSKLEENGWRLRCKVFEDPLQSNLAISMNASTRTLAEIMQLVPSEDAEQISEFRDKVYMPLHFLEKYLLPSMQLRKLIETSILYSLYHQTKMTRSSTQDNKLRSLIAHSDDEISTLVKDISELHEG